MDATSIILIMSYLLAAVLVTILSSLLMFYRGYRNGVNNGVQLKNELLDDYYSVTSEDLENMLADFLDTYNISYDELDRMIEHIMYTESGDANESDNA